MQADDARNGSEETATAFTISKTIAITREQSFSLQIYESKSKRIEASIEAVSFRLIATVE